MKIFPFFFFFVGGGLGPCHQPPGSTTALFLFFFIFYFYQSLQKSKADPQLIFINKIRHYILSKSFLKKQSHSPKIYRVKKTSIKQLEISTCNAILLGELGPLSTLNNVQRQIKNQQLAASIKGMIISVYSFLIWLSIFSSFLDFYTFILSYFLTLLSAACALFFIYETEDKCWYGSKNKASITMFLRSKTESLALIFSFITKHFP